MRKIRVTESNSALAELFVEFKLSDDPFDKSYVKQKAKVMTVETDSPQGDDQTSINDSPQDPPLWLRLQRRLLCKWIPNTVHMHSLSSFSLGDKAVEQGVSKPDIVQRLKSFAKRDRGHGWCWTVAVMMMISGSNSKRQRFNPVQYPNFSTKHASMDIDTIIVSGFVSK